MEETIDASNDYPSFNNTLLKKRQVNSTTNKIKESMF